MMHINLLAIKGGQARLILQNGDSIVLDSLIRIYYKNIYGT